MDDRLRSITRLQAVLPIEAFEEGPMDGVIEGALDLDLIAVVEGRLGLAPTLLLRRHRRRGEVVTRRGGGQADAVEHLGPLGVEVFELVGVARRAEREDAK